MTDHPTSHAEPSMEEILASIRRIMDDDDSTASGKQGAVQPSESAPQARTSTYADEDVHPAEETIFPERKGLLWRQVAGRQLAEEGGVIEEETLELTDIAYVGDEDEYELSELLTESADVTQAETTTGGAVTRDADSDTFFADEELRDHEHGHIGGAEGRLSSIPPLPENEVEHSYSVLDGGLDDEMTDFDDDDEDDDDDGEVLDLTRRVSGDVTIDDVADSMAGSETATKAAPGFVHTGLSGVNTSRDDVESADLQDAELELNESYEESLRPNSGFDSSPEEDDHERALDERFYEDDYDEAPEMEGDYVEAFGASAPVSAVEPTLPASDELDTVGGMVREALRTRNPAIVGNSDTAIVSANSEESASRSLATLAQYDGHTPRRAYSQLKITDDDDAPTIDAVVREELRPMLREWLNENLPTVVDDLVKKEVERISARSRRFVRREDD